MAENQLSACIKEGLLSGDVEALAALIASLLPDVPFSPDDCPMIAPAMLLGAPELEGTLERMQPPAGMGVVHESQVFRRPQPLALDHSLHIKGRIEEAGPSQRLVFSLLEDGDLIGAMESRLRFVTPDTMRALRGARFKDSMNEDGMLWFETAPFEAHLVSGYLALSHDPNPIHRVDAAAQAVGLPQAVVPGMLIAGVCEAVLDGRGVQAQEMRTRFMASLMVGESLNLGLKLTDSPKAKARVFAIDQQSQIVAICDFALRQPS